MSWSAIPGSPDVIHREAAAMITAADQMDRAATALKNVSNGGYQSLATDAIKENASTLAVTLTKASTRYRGAGEALKQFAKVLRPLQDQANRAITAGNHADVSSAQHALNAARVEEAQLIFQPADEAENERVKHELRLAEQEVAQRQRERDAAKADYDEAVQQWNDWAKKTAAAIGSSNEASQLNRASFLGIPLDTWHEVLENIGTVLTVLSILLCWVPGLGQILMIAIALVALAALVVSIVQASRGEKNWGEVAIEGAFAVVSVIGAVKAVKILGKARVFRLHGARFRNIFKPGQFSKWNAKWFGNATRRVAQAEKGAAFKNFFLKEHTLLPVTGPRLSPGQKTTLKIVNDGFEQLIGESVKDGIDKGVEYVINAPTAPVRLTPPPVPSGCSQYNSRLVMA